MFGEIDYFRALLLGIKISTGLRLTIRRGSAGPGIVDGIVDSVARASSGVIEPRGFSALDVSFVATVLGVNFWDGNDLGADKLGTTWGLRFGGDLPPATFGGEQPLEFAAGAADKRPPRRRLLTGVVADNASGPGEAEPDDSIDSMSSRGGLTPPLLDGGVVGE